MFQNRCIIKYEMVMLYITNISKDGKCYCIDITWEMLVNYYYITVNEKVKGLMSHWKRANLNM